MVALTPFAASAQAPPPPLITEAFADAETATLTFNGVGFREGFPVVFLGNQELPVRWAAERTAATWLPELRPGTYRLIARWPDGAQADFYLTIGAVGPAGPAGSPGPKGDRGLPGFGGGVAHFGAAPATAKAADADTTTTPTRNTFYGSHALGSGTATGFRNTAFGWRAAVSLTTGADNTGVGAQALTGVITGGGNTAVGAVALQSIGAGSRGNTAVGRGALRNILGSNNIGIGNNAGSAYAVGVSRAGTGSHNIYIGNHGRNVNSTGNNNIHIAHGARSNPTGSQNIYIGHTGAAGDAGVVRLGDGNTHTKTYLAGEVIIHGSITGVAGNPLDILGPVNAPVLDSRIDTLITGIRESVNQIDTRVTGIDTRLQALETAAATPAP